MSAEASSSVALASESFGDPTDPSVLLIMGVGSSMLWWDERFCRGLADRGLHVIRYDHRDTGQSTTREPGEGDYALADLVADAGRVLDDHGVEAAHVVGMSMGGMLAQLLTLDHPERVRSLALLSTSPGGDDLPGMSDDYAIFCGGPGPDWSDPESIAEYTLEDCRHLAGTGRAFDEDGTRALARADVARAINPASAANHFAVLGEDLAWRERLPGIEVPAAIVHGDADPLFGIEHGEALAAAIPGARLTRLEGAGHELHPDDWPVVLDVIIDLSTRG